MTKRRSLTPSDGPASAPGAQALRRGGTRQTVSDKVVFRPILASEGPVSEGPVGDGGRASSSGAEPRAGWALNVSRGGLRAILDEDAGAGGGKVELGQEYDVVLGESGEPRRGRIVWLQEEPDGFVVGVEFVALSGMHRAAEPPKAE